MIKITDKFKNIDGAEGTRSNMGDFQTLSYRFLFRIKEIAKDNPDLIKLLGVAFRKYNRSNFEKAQEHFETAIKQEPTLELELSPFLDICERVTLATKSTNDVLYENFLEEVDEWDRKPLIFKFFHRKPKYTSNSLSLATQVRCKYCGHYTTHINPDEGFAYFDQNNCDNCERGYPVACADWDNIDGQAYIYYRHSVTENEFYDEFEKKYNVNPGRNHFLAPKDK